MTLNHIVILIAFLLLGGCGNDRDANAPLDLPGTPLPGVYSGVFPCDGCPGIPTTLWLRSDGRFLLEQSYPAVDDTPPINTHSLGRWDRAADEATVLLTGSGPVRSFVRQDAYTLIMQTDSDIEHRLVRDGAAPKFSATIKMVGMMRMKGGDAWFKECLTGFEVPVDKAGDYARFRHQYRSASGRGKAVAVELDGRFIWARDGAPGSLTIERFVTVRAEGGC